MEPTARRRAADGSAGVPARAFSLTAIVYGVYGTCWSLVHVELSGGDPVARSVPPVGSTVVVTVFGRDR